MSKMNDIDARNEDSPAHFATSSHAQPEFIDNSDFMDMLRRLINCCIVIIANESVLRVQLLHIYQRMNNEVCFIYDSLLPIKLTNNVTNIPMA